MSAASSLLKPLAGFQLASLDAVAIAIAETNVELSPDHTLSRSSEIPAKSLAPILTHPEPFMEAVSEIVLGVRVAGRRRDSEPLHRSPLRPRNSEAVSIPQSKVVLRDIMVGQGRLVIPEHRSPCVSTNAASGVITRTQIKSGAHMSLLGRSLPHAERSFQVPTALVLAEGKPISQPELSVRVSIRRQLRQCSCGDHDSEPGFQLFGLSHLTTVGERRGEQGPARGVPPSARRVAVSSDRWRRATKASVTPLK
jgi:hypothetical protein